MEASDFYPEKLLSNDRAQWHKNGLKHNPGVDTEIKLASGTLASRSLGLHGGLNRRSSILASDLPSTPDLFLDPRYESRWKNVEGVVDENIRLAVAVSHFNVSGMTVTLQLGRSR